jgi:hypothetical protein
MFNEVEARHAKAGLEAARTVCDAQYAYGRQLRERFTTKTRAALVSMAGQLVRTARDAQGAGFALAGGVPEDLMYAPRSVHLDLAWGYIDRAVQDSLPTAAFAARGVGMEDVALALEEARARLVTVDRGELIHSDPPLAPSPVAGKRVVVGPHGDFYSAQRFLWSVSNYMADWASEGWMPVALVSPQARRVNLAGAWEIHALLVRKHIEAAALCVGISLYHAWDNLPNPTFSMVLAARMHLNKAVGEEGGAELFSGIGDEWDAAVGEFAVVVRAPYRRGNQRVRDAWRRMNRWNRECDRFLDGRGGEANR